MDTEKLAFGASSTSSIFSEGSKQQQGMLVWALTDINVPLDLSTCKRKRTALTHKHPVESNVDPKR
jgi:hypothetical protein